MNTSYSSLQFLLTYNLDHLKIKITHGNVTFNSINEWQDYLNGPIHRLWMPFRLDIETNETNLLPDGKTSFYCDNPDGDPYKFVAYILKTAILKTNVIKND